MEHGKAVPYQNESGCSSSFAWRRSWPASDSWGIEVLTHTGSGALSAASSSRYSTDGMKSIAPKPAMVHAPVIR